MAKKKKSILNSIFNPFIDEGVVENGKQVKSREVVLQEPKVTDAARLRAEIGARKLVRRSHGKKSK